MLTEQISLYLIPSTVETNSFPLASRLVESTRKVFIKLLSRLYTEGLTPILCMFNVTGCNGRFMSYHACHRLVFVRGTLPLSPAKVAYSIIMIKSLYGIILSAETKRHLMTQEMIFMENG